jgi:hypothetical protein
VKIVDVVSGDTFVGEEWAVGWVTGHIVVYNEIVSVVIRPTGQFVTVLWHDVIVYSTVVYTVEIVNSVAEVMWEVEDAIELVRIEVDAGLEPDGILKLCDICAEVEADPWASGELLEVAVVGNMLELRILLVKPEVE